MRLGVSSRGHWWVTMGPVGWLLTGWFVAPVLLAVYLIIGLVWLAAWACRASADPELDTRSWIRLHGADQGTGRR